MDRWNNEKTNAFATLLSLFFTPYESEITAEEDNVTSNSRLPSKSALSYKKFKISQVKTKISKILNPRKAPGYDLIIGKLLKEMPESCLRLIAYIFNTEVILGRFPDQWKLF